MVAAAAAVVVALLVRRRRQRAWSAALTTAGDDVGWFARELIPQLRSADSVDGLAGGWRVGESRVAAAEDRLTELVATAPADTARLRAVGLRDAVRTARHDVGLLLTAGYSPAPGRDLESIAARLEEALRAGRAATPGFEG